MQIKLNVKNTTKQAVFYLTDSKQLENRQAHYHQGNSPKNSHLP